MYSIASEFKVLGLTLSVIDEDLLYVGEISRRHYEVEVVDEIDESCIIVKLTPVPRFGAYPLIEKGDVEYRKWLESHGLIDPAFELPEGVVDPKIMFFMDGLAEERAGTFTVSPLDDGTVRISAPV